MNNEDLLARIKLLEQENRVLQQTIDELQQEKQNQYSFYPTPVSFHPIPMEYYISNLFWSNPANSFWNLPKRKTNRRDPRYRYFEENFPGMVNDDDITLGYGMMASEVSPENEEENAELRQKVGDLKKKIENLEKKLKQLNSPLSYVVVAIKDKARYDRPSAAYELFEKEDYIFRNCEQWKENVKERGYVPEGGMELDGIMPSINPFDPNANREGKIATVLEKIKAFFHRFADISDGNFETDSSYVMSSTEQAMKQAADLVGKGQNVIQHITIENHFHKESSVINIKPDER